MSLRSLIAALLFAAGVAAQAAPSRLLTDYTHTAWTRLQGAPSDVVKFAQTPDGWLWIASPSGLTRFDGASFERVEALGGHRLPSASTMGLLASRDGGLWIGHRFGGITALVAGKVREYGTAEGLPPSAVFSMTEGPDGSIDRTLRPSGETRCRPWRGAKMRNPSSGCACTVIIGFPSR